MVPESRSKDYSQGSSGNILYDGYHHNLIESKSGLWTLSSSSKFVDLPSSEPGWGPNQKRYSLKHTFEDKRLRKWNKRFEIKSERKEKKKRNGGKTIKEWDRHTQAFEIMQNTSKKEKEEERKSFDLMLLMMMEAYFQDRFRALNRKRLCFWRNRFL